MASGTQGLWELLHGGDWACAHADDETLARVALELARSVEDKAAGAARAVATWAGRDMSQASLRWAALADELRARADGSRPPL